MNYLSKTFVSVVSLSVLFFVADELSNYYINHKEAQTISYENDKLIFDNFMSAQEQNLKIFSDALVLNENVKNAYRQNDPELIKKTIQPLWEQEKINKLIHEIHFFKPPAISFVNFSNFKSINHDVSDVRSDIVWITSAFKPSYHPFVCKTYAGLRATVPIMENNSTILGALSIGKQIDWLPEFMKQQTHHDSFLVYTKKSTNPLVNQYYDEFIKDKQIRGDYILANQTKQIDVSLLDTINFSLTKQNIIVDGKKYLLNIYPIIDFNNNTMAYLSTLDDLNSFYETFYKLLLNNLLFIIVTAMSILILTKRTTNLLIKQINHIAQISNKIKQRDFKVLYQKTTINSGTNLDILEKDIIDMGKEIEQKYTILEEESKHKTELIVKQLYTDKLTRLSNRNALFRDLDLYHASYLAILNIQAFHRINDVFGFEAGNLILEQLSSKLQILNSKEIYNIYRIGNDEFIILNHIPISQQKFEMHIQTVINDIEKKDFYLDEENTMLNINIYAGISFNKTNKLATSNIAMRTTKDMRKDYVVYSERTEIQSEQEKNIKTIEKIKYALQEGNIISYFQPILDNTQTIIKYESLVRMKDNDKIISPYFFLELSKSTKYYHQISEQVIIQTFETFQNRDEQFSINLTAQDITNEDTITLIYKKLTEVSDITKVVFEIVESEDIHSLEVVHHFLRKVKELGAKIAIDDFGTGFSNFSYIMELQPDYLKIDGSIIKNIDTNLSAKKVTQAIVIFAHTLDIKVVAEFVHSKEVFEMCQELGVDEYQGFYFGEPMPL